MVLQDTNSCVIDGWIVLYVVFFGVPFYFAIQIVQACGVL